MATGARIRARLRHRPAGRGGDSGSSTLELAIIAPVVLLLFCGALQLGLWFLGRETALTAARKGVDAGRGSESSPGQGAARAQSWLQDAGSVLKDPGVSTAGSNADRVQITVTGHVVTLVPGWSMTIQQSAQGPVENWDVTG